MNLARAEIIVTGLVQGVGFRYFALRTARQLGLTGYTKNLYDGSVYNIVEGEKFLIEEYFNKLKIGPMHASVKSANIKWEKYKNEFTTFKVKY